MRKEFSNPSAQRTLAEENHPLQTRFLDTAYESLRIGVQVRRMRWQRHGLHSSVGKHIQKPRREQRVAVMKEVALSIQNPLSGGGQIPGNLDHPEFVRCRSDACDLPCEWTDR